MRSKPTSVFLDLLAAANPKPAKLLSWVFINEDQLSDRIGPLVELEPARTGIVLIESHWKASLRPYHKQRLALIWANQRHFALEQARRGVHVRYLTATTPYRAVLAEQAKALGPLQAMTPAEREMRADLLPLIQSKQLHLVRHDGWLTTRDDFTKSQSGPPWRMDKFYRHVRKQSGILMEGPKLDKYVGGKLSFDVDNRLRWDGDPQAPKLPVFKPDAIVSEVCDMVERDFAHHPGVLDRSSIPATLAQCQSLWKWALKSCMTEFGPYEDAMSSKSRTIFHTRIGAIMNLHRILPRDVVADAEKADIPLSSKEGFIRQILGWREFVHHVHIATDGFRTLPPESGSVPVTSTPGHGGYALWTGKPWPVPDLLGVDSGGAQPAFLAGRHTSPLPPVFWDSTQTPSGMNCLDQVVTAVWQESYSHHITRLMVLSNIATLLDISPRELTDWFWAAYADAWDWVVEPNVLGMGTYAAGEVMTTKPYIAGSAYINKMSDYCRGCRFKPDVDCPLKFLYWAFLERHKARLDNNPRLFMPMRSLAKRAASAKAADAKVFDRVVQLLVRGEPLTAKALL